MHNASGVFYIFYPKKETSLASTRFEGGDHMTNIHIKESTIICPAQETPKHSLWISNLDLLIPIVHNAFVYFYRPPPNDSSDFFESCMLKEALSKVLVPFYPMAGRLGRDENGRLEVNCNAKGVVFIEAETSCVVDDLGDFTPTFKTRQLVPTVESSNDISSFPLLALQVTHFKCGGASLGVLWQHTLSDGTSAGHFINAWAEITRGLSISIEPFLDRTILRAQVPYPKFHHIEYDPPPTMNTVTEKHDIQSNPKPTSTTILKISLDQINILREKSMNDGTVVRYSTYAILAAHIWRCMCKARGLPNDQVSKAYIPVNGRPRLNPPLPPGYFGNALFQATPINTSGVIQSEPFTSTVERVHAALKRMDDEYLKSSLAYVEQQHDPLVLRRGAHSFNCPNASIVSWVTLSMTNADFGWGRPVYVGPASVTFEGKVYILPNPSNDGSLSLIVCLETSHMLQLFKKYFYDFLKFNRVSLSSKM